MSILNGDDTPHASDQESEGENLPKFDFPMFGNSPGPSPVPTPPSHPATPEIEEVVEVSFSTNKITGNFCGSQILSVLQIEIIIAKTASIELQCY